MTKPILTDELAQYFELRDKVAALLKVAGVKKRARHYVAEVLIDAGVIDFAELEEAVTLDGAPHGEAQDADALEAALEAFVGRTFSGYGQAIQARAAADGSGAEVLIRSADFDVPDQWVTIAEILAH